MALCLNDCANLISYNMTCAFVPLTCKDQSQNNSYVPPVHVPSLLIESTDSVTLSLLLTPVSRTGYIARA